MSTGKAAGMSEAQARTTEGLIIALCLFALFAIFQPFSLGLFSFGCGLVVFGGLVFNLVPLCQPGRPARDLWKAAVVIAHRVRRHPAAGAGLGLSLRRLSRRAASRLRPLATNARKEVLATLAASSHFSGGAAQKLNH